MVEMPESSSSNGGLARGNIPSPLEAYRDVTRVIILYKNQKSETLIFSLFSHEINIKAILPSMGISQGQDRGTPPPPKKK